MYKIVKLLKKVLVLVYTISKSNTFVRFVSRGNFSAYVYIKLYCATEAAFEQVLCYISI